MEPDPSEIDAWLRLSRTMDRTGARWTAPELHAAIDALLLALFTGQRWGVARRVLRVAFEAGRLLTRREDCECNHAAQPGLRRSERSTK